MKVVEMKVVEIEGAQQYLNDVVGECFDAMSGHPPLHSHHEALAVIEEELSEYRAWVYQKPAARDKAAMYRELVQIAAMCLRTIIDRNVTSGNEEVEI